MLRGDALVMQAQLGTPASQGWGAPQLSCFRGALHRLTSSPAFSLTAQGYRGMSSVVLTSGTANIYRRAAVRGGRALERIVSKLGASPTSLL